MLTRGLPPKVADFGLFRGEVSEGVEGVEAHGEAFRGQTADQEGSGVGEVPLLQRGEGGLPNVPHGIGESGPGEVPRPFQTRPLSKVSGGVLSYGGGGIHEGQLHAFHPHGPWKGLQPLFGLRTTLRTAADGIAHQVPRVVRGLPDANL
jgi:hypothetical protein